MLYPYCLRLNFFERDDVPQRAWLTSNLEPDTYDFYHTLSNAITYTFENEMDRTLFILAFGVGEAEDW